MSGDSSSERHPEHEHDAAGFTPAISSFETGTPSEQKTRVNAVAEGAMCKPSSVSMSASSGLSVQKVLPVQVVDWDPFVQTEVPVQPVHLGLVAQELGGPDDV